MIIMDDISIQSLPFLNIVQYFLKFIKTLKMEFTMVVKKTIRDKIFDHRFCTLLIQLFPKMS
jgi:hypothetical protein